MLSYMVEHAPTGTLYSVQRFCNSKRCQLQARYAVQATKCRPATWYPRTPAWRRDPWTIPVALAISKFYHLTLHCPIPIQDPVHHHLAGPTNSATSFLASSPFPFRRLFQQTTRPRYWLPFEACPNKPALPSLAVQLPHPQNDRLARACLGFEPSHPSWPTQNPSRSSTRATTFPLHKIPMAQLLCAEGSRVLYKLNYSAATRAHRLWRRRWPTSTPPMEGYVAPRHAPVPIQSSFAVFAPFRCRSQSSFLPGIEAMLTGSLA